MTLVTNHIFHPLQSDLFVILRVRSLLHLRYRACCRSTTHARARHRQLTECFRFGCRPVEHDCYFLERAALGLWEEEVDYWEHGSKGADINKVKLPLNGLQRYRIDVLCDATLAVKTQVVVCCISRLKKPAPKTTVKLIERPLARKRNGRTSTGYAMESGVNAMS